MPPIFILNVPCATFTTTTTTTLAPVTFDTTTTCVGSTVDILLNNFAGGTGTYSWAASGSFESTVIQNLQGLGTRYAITGPSYTFSGLPQSTTIYVGIQDSGGNRKIVSVSTPSCATTTTTTTTTTTSTTTTTTTAAGNQVAIYSRAGAAAGGEYDLYYSEDNVNWTLAVSNRSSTTCTLQTTVGNSSGTIYLKAQRSIGGNQIYIRGANTSTCPANLDLQCVFSAAITGNEDVAITVFVNTGTSDFRNC